MTGRQHDAKDMVDEVVDGFAAELPRIDSLRLETVCRLIVAGRGLEQKAAGMLKRFGFNYTDFDVLGMLRSSGPPYELTVAEILKFTMITSGAMTTCLDRLEGAGMIGRRVGDQDRRVRVVSLTDKGMEVIEEALVMRFDEANGVLSDLTREEIETLNGVLRRLRFETP